MLQDYDENGDYIRTWIPELKNVPPKRIHEPWLMSKQEQEQYGVQIGQDYPAPIPSSQFGRPHGGDRLLFVFQLHEENADCCHDVKSTWLVLVTLLLEAMLFA